MQAHSRWVHSIRKHVQTQKKKWRKNKQNAIVFASTQLRLTRLRKYPIDSKAYLGHCLYMFRLRNKKINFKSHILFKKSNTVYIHLVQFFFMKGRSYAVYTQKMLNGAIESLVQKVQSGVVIQFEKIGPDPPLLQPDGK